MTGRDETWPLYAAIAAYAANAFAAMALSGFY